MKTFPIAIFKGLYVHTTCKLATRIKIPIIEDHGDYAVCSLCGWKIPRDMFYMAARKLNEDIMKRNPELKRIAEVVTGWREL